MIIVRSLALIEIVGSLDQAVLIDTTIFIGYVFSRLYIDCGVTLPAQDKIDVIEKNSTIDERYLPRFISLLCLLC